MTEELKKEFSKLRFLDENGEAYPEWEEKKLEEIGQILTGSTPPKNNLEYWNSAKHNWYSPTDFTSRKIDNSKDKISDSGLQKVRKIPANSVMVTCIGSIGKMSMNATESSTNQQINTIVPKDMYISEMVYYLMQHKMPSFVSLKSSNVIPIINKTTMGAFELPIPSLPEQTKIADFLSKIDERIEAQSKLVELLKKQKQGYSQKIFNGSLRFKKDDGTDYDDWEEKKLGELFNKYEEKTYVKDDVEYGQVTVSKTGKITHRAFTFGSNIGRKRQFVINLENHPNTLTFIRQGVAEGGIGIIPNELNGHVVTENMPLLSFEEKNVSKSYINQYIKSDLYYQDILKDLIPNGSAQKAIHEKDWLKKISIFPSLPEQEKIAAFLSSLDNRIDQQLSKLEQLKQEKQAYMQRMLG